MKINLIAIGTRPPKWVANGYEEYATRLSQDFSLELIEVPATKRIKSTHLVHALEEEGQRLLKAVPPGSILIALDRCGQELDTPSLAEKMTTWHHSSQELSLLIGGPEGLSATCLDRADACWSLSKLTLPHPLVRIVVAEQIYRAWSIMRQHPYHR